MGVKKLYMKPVEELDLTAVKYEREEIKAPHLSGFGLKLFVRLLEAPVIGSFITNHLKIQNRIVQELENTVIPERPMFYPEFPPQDPETGVVVMEEESAAITRVETALQCLPSYDAASGWTMESSPFLYWKIRDFAHAYRASLVTPLMVAEYVISAVEEFENKKPPMPLLVTFSAEEVRNQAEASTQRFKEGKPLSIVDGIFMAIKDDIDSYPYPTKGATTWYHKVRSVKEDVVCVSRLRSCGVIFIRKVNMHELGLGTTGNNPNYGTTRNPHDLERYTGGSSSGPTTLVVAGICSAALGTDGGGSVRIPSSLCGVVGLKSTYARTNMKGYAPILGSSLSQKYSLHPREVPESILPLQQRQESVAESEPQQFGPTA